MTSPSQRRAGGTRTKVSFLAFLVIGTAGVAVLAWLVTRGAMEPEAPAEVLTQGTQATAFHLPPALPESATGQSPEDTAALMTPIAVEAEAPVSASGVPIVSKREAFDHAYDAMEASMTGALSPDQFLSLTQELLAHIDPNEKPFVSADGKTASQTLLDDPEFGRVTLNTRVVPLSAAEAGETGAMDFYSIETHLNMQPGHLSGFAEDGAESARMHLNFAFDAENRPTKFSLLTQTDYKLTMEIRARLGPGVRVPTGATMVIGLEGSSWQQTFMEDAQKEDGRPSVLFALTDPEDVAGSLADSRTGAIGGQLRATKPAGKPVGPR